MQLYKKLCVSFTHFSPTVTSCVIMIQYHNQEIGIDRSIAHLKYFDTNSLISSNTKVVFMFLYCLIIFSQLLYYNQEYPHILKCETNKPLTVCCLLQPSMDIYTANPLYTRCENGKGQRDKENPT